MEGHEIRFDAWGIPLKEPMHNVNRTMQTQMIYGGSFNKLAVKGFGVFYRRIKD
jgi:hypothetical protein